MISSPYTSAASLLDVDDLQPVHLGGEFAGDHGDAWRWVGGQVFGAAGGVVPGHSGQFAPVEIAFALRQRLWMAAHLRNHGAVARNGQQVVPHAQQNFAVHLEIVVEQQIVGFVDAARSRVFHRHGAIIRPSLFHGVKNLFEGAAG